MKLVFLFLIAFIECKKFEIATQMCYPKAGERIECHGKYKYNCGQFVCTKNEYSCQMLSLFSGLKGKHREKYESFINEVKECSEPPKYKLKSNDDDVCFNSNKCVTTLLRIWPYNRVKLTECKCTSKYDYKCNRDFCALSKLACEGLNKNVTEIKIC